MQKQGQTNEIGGVTDEQGGAVTLSMLDLILPGVDAFSPLLNLQTEFSNTFKTDFYIPTLIFLMIFITWIQP